MDFNKDDGVHLEGITMHVDGPTNKITGFDSNGEYYEFCYDTEKGVHIGQISMLIKRAVAIRKLEETDFGLAERVSLEKMLCSEDEENILLALTIIEHVQLSK